MYYDFNVTLVAGENLAFILKSMRSMVPEWKSKTFFKDGKLSPDDIRNHFPELDIGIHVCTFHMFRLDLPLALGKYPVFEAVKTDLYGMKNARDTADFESRWTQFKAK